MLEKCSSILTWQQTFETHGSGAELQIVFSMDDLLRVILVDFFSKKLLSGSFPNFRGIIVHIQTIKINFYVTKCSIEIKIYEHVR